MHQTYLTTIQVFVYLHLHFCTNLLLTYLLYKPSAKRFYQSLYTFKKKIIPKICTYIYYDTQTNCTFWRIETLTLNYCILQMWPNSRYDKYATYKMCNWYPNYVFITFHSIGYQIISLCRSTRSVSSFRNDHSQTLFNPLLKVSIC